MADRLSLRALNRALLARQLLLTRAGHGVAQAVEHLVAMQAQSPQAPYVGLWSRLAAFDPEELSRLLVDRTVVRATTLRTTVHLSTTRDYLSLRPLLQPVIEKAFRSTPFRRNLEGVDLADVAGAGLQLLTERPRSRAALGPLLEKRFPGSPGESLAHAATLLEPMVQVPPRGVWRASGQAVFTPSWHWLGRGPGTPLVVDDLLRRYLAAYGPATVADAQVWSGLTGLREVADRLRPRLLVLADQDGRELLDLPDAPRPAADEPAPVRLLPEYDNLLLSHADRSRVIADGHGPRVFMRGAVLVDGHVTGAWKTSRRSGTTRLAVEPFRRLTASERTDIELEAGALLDFLAPDDDHRVELEDVA